MNPKVSVVIPVYNAQENLQRCIDSLKAQTLQDYEALFVDDCSTDQTVEMLRNAFRDDSRIRILCQEEKTNAGAARNRGIREHRGQYLVFLDGDDGFAPELLEKASRALDATGADMVTYHYRRMEANGKIRNMETVSEDHRLLDKEVFSYKDCPDRILNLVHTAPWEKMLRSSFIRENQIWFDEIRSENDLTFSLLSVAKAQKIARLDDILYDYYLGHNGTLTQNKNKTFNDMVTAVKSAYRQISQLPYFKEIELSCTAVMAERLNDVFITKVQDWTTPDAKRYYQSIREIYRSDWYACWKKARPQIREDYLWVFDYVRTHSYEAFMRAKAHGRFALPAAKKGMDRFLFRANRKVKKILRTLKDKKKRIRRIPGQPAVSVVFPVYNAEKYIQRCVKCLKKQTLRDWEAFFVDDCSTDQTVKLLEQAIGRDRRCHILRQEQKTNAGAARNRGLREVHGRYTIFLDADDTFLPQMFEKLAAALEQTDADIALCNYYRITPDGKKRIATAISDRKMSPKECVFSYRNYAEHLLDGIDVSVWHRMCRTAFLRENHICFDEIQSHNDSAFSQVGLAKAKKIVNVPECLYEYHVTVEGSLSTCYVRDKTFVYRKYTFDSIYRQIHDLPYFDQIEGSFYKFVIARAVRSFSKFIAEWSSPEAREYYEYLHRLFLSDAYQGWESQNQGLADLVYQAFLAIRERSYEEFFALWNHRLVVSLTSYPARIHCVATTVESILRQTRQADEIVLWLGQEQFPKGDENLPRKLVRLKEQGKLVIRYCDDLKPHKKYFYALQAYPDCILVTVDDDVVYEKDLLEALFISYLRFPKAVSAGRVHLMLFEGDRILPYAKWPRSSCALLHQPCMQLLATGVGGCLYPPHCFPELADRKDVIRQICLRADDLWLKMLELHHGLPVVLAWNKTDLCFVENSQVVGLWSSNVVQNQNDPQMLAIHQWYDGQFGQGALIKKLADTTLGVDQTGVEAVSDHFESVMRRKLKKQAHELIP